MSPETALLWSWLNVLTKKRADALVKVYGTLGQAAKNIDESLLRNLGCREDTVLLTLNRLEAFDASQYQRELERRSLRLLSIENATYPAHLRELLDQRLHERARRHWAATEALA